jgi:succinate dehydrogenase / fumarate reductase, cytochrome b subunit
MMPARARPTSPHLWIYRWQLGNTLSIVHRMTGAFMSIGLILLAYWWVALASGPAAFAGAVRTLGSPLGLLVMFGLSVSFWFHLLNGVRHLFWDAGRGFEKPARHVSGWAAIAGAVLLTAGLWILVWRHMS